MPDCVWFHVVTEGELVLVDSDGRTRQLGVGDIVVLPHGAGHRIADDGDSPTPVVFDVPHQYATSRYAVLRHGGGGVATDVMCGVVHLGHPAARMLLGVLPEIIHIETAERRDEWLWLPGVLSLMAAEARTMRPGGEAVVTRLSDVLVIQAIRAWIDTDPAADTGWIRALRDPQIGQAIAMVHRDPSRPWTVASLADGVAMSRSNFSARFSELVGVAPKRYVTHWRMQLAHDMLRDGTHTIVDVANALGYGSDAAFSRAFTRETGSAPSSVRRGADVVDTARDRVAG